MKNLFLYIRILFVAFLLLSVVAAIVVFRIGDEEVGGSASGERFERIEKSPNYDGSKFVNAEPTEHLAQGIYWNVIRDYLFSRAETRPSEMFSTESTDLINLDKTCGLQLFWLGHSTVLVNIDSTTILIDPVFDERVAVIVGSTERFQSAVINRESLPKIDAVIISHDHYDHLEKNSIDFFAQDGTMFFVPLGVGAHLNAWQVPDSQIVELDWWESRDFQSLKIVCTPARHFSGRSLLRFDKTLWASWVVVGSTHRLYYGGDTGYTDQFEKIGDRFGPFNVTLLPIGAYSEYWPDIHLNPEEAVTAHLALKGRLLIPVHWGTFDVALHAWDEPIERLIQAAEEQEVQIAAPLPGEKINLDSVTFQNKWWQVSDRIILLSVRLILITW